MPPQMMIQFPGICEVADDWNYFPADVAILTNLHSAHQQARDYVKAVCDDQNI